MERAQHNICIKPPNFFSTIKHPPTSQHTSLSLQINRTTQPTESSLHIESLSKHYPGKILCLCSPSPCPSYLSVCAFVKTPSARRCCLYTMEPLSILQCPGMIGAGIAMPGEHARVTDLHFMVLVCMPCNFIHLIKPGLLSCSLQISWHERRQATRTSSFFCSNTA